MTATVTLAVKKCRRCGTVDAPTRTLCSNCLADNLDPIGVEGLGTLVSWTTIRRAPTQFADDAPYDVCIVDLSNGQRVTGRLAGSADIAPGAPVRAIELRGDIPIFSPLR